MSYKVEPEMKRKLERDFAHIDNPSFMYAAKPVKSEVHWTPEEDNIVMEYVNKKKSAGKVDQVVGNINATYLIEQEILYGMSDFTVQTG